MKVCILLLCGLPGAGKTHVANTLKGANPDGYKFVHVCYDDLIKDVDHSKNLNAWKTARSCIADHINALIFHLTSDGDIDGIKLPSKSDGNIHLSEVTSIYTEAKNVGKDSVIFIIDDNMQYRGMRYEYFKICRKYAIPFGIVYFDIPTDSCIERNARRQMKISPDVIRKLNIQMEAPNELKNNWERHICILSQNDMSDINYVQMKIFETVKSMEKCPVMPQIPDHAAAEESRLETRKSFMHQADICLRKFVSREMTHYKNLADATSMKASSQKLNLAKKAVTSYLKMGYIDETNFLDDFGQIDLKSLESKICDLMSSETEYIAKELTL